MQDTRKVALNIARKALEAKLLDTSKPFGVWQYASVGAAYIPRALAAQRSPEGYNYGGIGPLERSGSLEAFNYEQQADIIEDAYRLTSGHAAQWHGFGPEVLPVYFPYLAEVRKGPGRAC